MEKQISLFSNQDTHWLPQTDEASKEVDAKEKKMGQCFQTSREENSKNLEQNWDGEFDKEKWTERFTHHSREISRECQWIANDPQLRNRYQEQIKKVYQLMEEIIQKDEIKLSLKIINRITNSSQIFSEKKSHIRFNLCQNETQTTQAFDLPVVYLTKLCQNSPYFTSLLQSPFKEKEDGIVNLENVSVSSFKNLFKWLKDPSDCFQGMDINALFDFLQDILRFQISNLIKEIDLVLANKIELENVILIMNVFSKEGEILNLPATLQACLLTLSARGILISPSTACQKEEWQSSIILQNETFFQSQSYQIRITSEYLDCLSEEENLEFLNRAKTLHLILDLPVIPEEAKKKLAAMFPATTTVTIVLKVIKDPILWDFFENFTKLSGVLIELDTEHQAKESLRILDETFFKRISQITSQQTSADSPFQLGFLNLEKFSPTLKYFPLAPVDQRGSSHQSSLNPPIEGHLHSLKSVGQVAQSADSPQKDNSELSIKDFIRCLKLTCEKIDLFGKKYGQFTSLLTDSQLLDLLQHERIDLSGEELKLDERDKLTLQSLKHLFKSMTGLKHLQINVTSDFLVDFISQPSILENLPQLSILEFMLSIESFGEISRDKFDSFFRGLFANSQHPRTVKFHFPLNVILASKEIGAYFQLIAARYPNASIEVLFNENFTYNLKFFKTGSLLELTPHPHYSPLRIFQGDSENNIFNQKLNNFHPLKQLKGLIENLPSSLSLQMSILKNYQTSVRWANPLKWLAHHLPRIQQVYLPLNQQFLEDNPWKFEALDQLKNLQGIELEIGVELSFSDFLRLFPSSSLYHFLQKNKYAISFKQEGLEQVLGEKSQMRHEEMRDLYLEQAKALMGLIPGYHPLTRPFHPYVGKLIDDDHLLELKLGNERMFPRTKLYFTHLTKITDQGLMKFLECFHEISFMDLEGCTTLTQKSINFLIAKYPSIEINLPSHLNLQKQIMFERFEC
jgi:hypothetical protein